MRISDWSSDVCSSDLPRASPASGTQFDAFQSYAGKTIGYAGNLETKIDIELLSRVADRFRDCQVVLIGSTHANPAVMELLRHPHVSLPAVVPYAHPGSWLAKFDARLEDGREGKECVREFNSRWSLYH